MVMSSQTTASTPAPVAFLSCGRYLVTLSSNPTVPLCKMASTGMSFEMLPTLYTVSESTTSAPRPDFTAGARW